MNYTHILTYLLFLFLWISSPGPSFAFIARNSMKYGVKAGLLTMVGMVIGDTVCITLAVIGVAEFLSHHPKILNAGKIIGAAYIFYIGIDILLSTFRRNAEEDILKTQVTPSKTNFIIKAILVDISNPLVIIGMLAIVLRFINPAEGAGHTVLYTLLLPLTTAYVSSGVTLIFGNPVTRRIVIPYIKWFERIAGIAIALLAILMIIE